MRGCSRRADIARGDRWERGLRDRRPLLGDDARSQRAARRAVIFAVTLANALEVIADVLSGARDDAGEREIELIGRVDVAKRGLHAHARVAARQREGALSRLEDERLLLPARPEFSGDRGPGAPLAD